MGGELRVVATAGHVDHGKSSLVQALTGTDPDRWAEEKRRGLTIDLGYAWCALPSGREIGFVDVPGHERFIRNMLAGVGPVRLVLFVVAADEGWKPQSEEHLAILDVLGVDGGVVALAKRDLVDDETFALATEEVSERLSGTALEGAPIVPVSSTTGEGIGELARALDRMFAGASAPPTARARQFVDRVFTIRGAGTVVTGTLTGDCLAVGDEAEVYPTGRRGRIRSLQTHKRSEDRACPISRVAANLVGVEREELERGDVLARPGEWRPTREFDAVIRPIRGIARPITSRGAFKVYAGAAEADAALRFLGSDGAPPGGEAFVRIRASRPLVLDVGDRFVLREAGRRATVGGGTVLDVAPPRRPASSEAVGRLSARAAAARREDLPALLVAERGAILAHESWLLTGTRATAGRVAGGWFVDERVASAAGDALSDELARFHAQRPLEQGAPLALARERVSAALQLAGSPTAPDLVDALIDDLAARGLVARDATTVRLATHRVALEERGEELARLMKTIEGASPPTVAELVASGLPKELIEAAARTGEVVRVSQDLVFSPELVREADSWIRNHAEGFTVSAFREAFGTSRRYALPLLEWFDARGVTRRDGDLRFPRG